MVRGVSTVLAVVLVAAVAVGRPGSVAPIQPILRPPAYFIAAGEGLLGYFAIDGHVHSNVTKDAAHCSLDDVAAQAKAAGLDAVVMTEHNHVHDRAELEALGVRTGMTFFAGEEAGFRGGHVGIWGGRRHARTEPEERRSLDSVLAAARAECAGAEELTVLNHPAWWLGENLFSEAVLRRPDGTPRVDAIELWNGQLARSTNTNVGRWDDLLRRGVYVPAIGASDSHFRMVGLPRLFLLAPDPTLDSLIRAARRGRGFVTDDAWVELDVAGHTYGSLLTIAEPLPLPVFLRGSSRHGGVLRVIRNGEAVDEMTLAPGESFERHMVVGTGTEDGYLRLEIRRHMDTPRRRGDQIVFIGNPLRWDLLPAGDHWR